LSRSLREPAEARQLLIELGAPPWLVRHHDLVVEAMQLLADRLTAQLGLAFDRELTLVGAGIHDVGKVLYPEEMIAPGHQHEPAGQQLLLTQGVPARVARFCVTHAAWDDDACAIEDLLVALADKLWKGKREEPLERRVMAVIGRLTHREPWEIFDSLDAICEAIAADGADRLARSRV
jgi:hypothetical protein